MAPPSSSIPRRKPDGVILRTAILIVAALAFTAALFGAFVDPGVWPTALVMAVIVLGTWFERRRYGALQARPVEPGWQPTSERFIDDASGRPVIVWYNPATGERRYVSADDHA
jgi:hypothetical protein